MFMTLGCRTKLFLSKSSGGLEKSRFSVSIWKSDEQHDFWKKVWPTSDMQRNLVCFLSKLFQHYTARENCIIRGHKNLFKTKFFERFNTFFVTWDFDRFFPAFCQTFFARVVNTATFTSGRAVWGNKLFKINYKFFKFFGQWARKFWLSGKFFQVRSLELHATCP